jgi:hypothetical protein
LAVVDGGRGQPAGDRDLAAGHFEVEFVAGPGLFFALTVFLAADVAGGGQVTQSLWPRLRVTCRSRRVGPGFGRSSSLRRRPALARRRGIIGAGGSSLPSLALLGTGFSRASISAASRAIAPMMRLPRARSISAAWTLSGSRCSMNATRGAPRGDHQAGRP